MTKRLYTLRPYWIDTDPSVPHPYPLPLLMKKIDPLKTIGKWAELERLLNQGLSVVRPAGKVPETADLIYSLATMAGRKAEFDRALELGGEALDMYTKLGNLQAQAKTTNMIGLMYYYRGTYQQALGHFQRSLEMAKASGNIFSQMIALGNIGLVHADRGEYRQALEYYQLQLTHAEANRDLKTSFLALANIGNLQYSTGRYEQATDYHRRCLAIAEKTGDRSDLGSACWNLGQCLQATYEYGQARTLLEKALHIFETLGDPQSVSWLLSNLGDLSILTGDYRAAAAYLEQAQAGAGSHLLTSAHNSRVRGRLALRQSDYALADSLFRKVLDIYRKSDVRDILTEHQYELAELLFLKGGFDESKKLAREALQAAAILGNQNLSFKIRVLLARILSRQDLSAAEKAFQELLGQADDDEQLATVYCEWYKLIGQDEHRQKALSLLQPLYRRTRAIAFRDMIKDLEPPGDTN
jgi:tetratricopeptide (TPR) repeat protein